MLSLIGNSLLIISLVASFGAILFKNKVRFICFYLGSSVLVISFVILVVAFISSDFSIKNVFLNSSSLLPLIYKIAACWASHEGSMLLWVALLALVGFAYIYYADFSSESREFAVVILAFIQVVFISFIIFTSNPFEEFSFVPHQGMGLNPMLQDMALSIHPPLLYLGNVGYVALFVSGCLLLYTPEESKRILKIARLFSSFSLMTLSAGIGLGSWWAYRELGWGGFWFFDPVENISLLPWLSGIALHHFLIISERNGGFMRWMISLSLSSFLLSLYGTFIVRSGIISSVHSFAFSPERGLYILSICVVLTLLCLMWFVVKHRYLPRANSVALYERIMLVGNVLWIAALISIIIALIYPIYCSFVLGIEIVIDPEYFTSVFIPIFIPILLFTAITPVVAQKLRWLTIALAIISGLATFALSFWVEFGIISASISFAAISLMLQTLSLVFVSPSSFLKYSLLLGHFGFGLLALSILLNSLLAQEIDFVGKVGEQVSNQGMSVKLEDIKFTDGVNYYRQIAVFKVEDKNGSVIILKPENRLYKVENTLSQEVDIYSFLFYDFYAVLSRVDNKTMHAKIYYQPFISFIWFSVLIISAGFGTLLFSRKSIKV
ncbi:MAG: cytochrome c biogenesis protein CcsA [Rickettsiaceae bacterium]|nr:cytochrome c biogenesis protein CcsA [Rickettsiaceae bacterium]MDP4832933.1 cytochrome c biogenesis protein CcsA [Rickettsiaceae bacterium]MDP5020750.1 cytochrome c biogenesis protein CcsA [Rickettsiaceae bacterium]MDP5083473.1 cytochrome c biogenesis protein CcsA [Rickettsiaceae bacterium]